MPKKMKKPLQSPAQILGAAANQGDDLVGTQKPVPVDKPDDFMVAFRQLDWRNPSDTLKARKSGHPTSMNETSANQTTCRIASFGNQ